MKLVSLLFVFVLFSASEMANAFPEMVRHGYVNCSACHVSPNGGGVLSAYGRSLSKELLSTWGKEGEENIGHGLLEPTPEWLTAGGDIRTIQTYLDNSQTQAGQIFTMQAELEAGVTAGKWVADLAIGVQGGPRGTPKRGEFISPRHYLMYRATDEINIRLGRFFPAFGLYQPNHSAYVRRSLGFDQNRETYNLEASYLGERFDIFATAIAGRPDDLRIASENGAAFSTSYNFKEKNKIGLSVLATEGRARKREAAGVSTILTLPHHFYILSEVDYQILHPKPAGFQEGALSFFQLSLEAVQGVHFYLQHQLSYLNFKNVNTRKDSIGVGFKFYPRPHFEFTGEIASERNLHQTRDRYEIGWLIFHYYL